MDEYTSSDIECVSLEESFLFMSNDGSTLYSNLNGDLAALNGQFSAKDSVKDLVMVKGYNSDLHKQAVGKLRSYFSPCFVGHPYPVTVRVKGVPLTSYAFSIVGVHKNKLYKIRIMMAADMIKIVGISENLFHNYKIPKDVIYYAIKNANPNFSLKINRNSISSMLTGVGYRENTAFNNAVLNYASSRHPDIITKMVGTAIQNIIQFKKK
jgi:hypothetical protein